MRPGEPLPIGRMLDGRYRIHKGLGQGGMGRVYLANDTRLANRPVAVKEMILGEGLHEQKAIEDFAREARVLASIRHANVVSIFAVGPAEGRGGLFYFVMEYLEGTLDRLIAERALEPDAVVRLGQGLLSGLAKVHRSGVVHRDVKPSNIFLRDGVPVLGDFGIAKHVTGSDASTFTEPGHYAGTPAYMAPEQLARAEATPASDLYAMGMVLYEAVTGRHWEVPAPNATGNWTGVPRALRQVLRRALASGGRLPSAREAETLAARWRPWRAYAALHLWSAYRKEKR